MNGKSSEKLCPDCDVDLGRRKFLLGVGATAAAATAGALGWPSQGRAEPVAKGAKVGPAEANVKRLFESLTAEQKARVVLPYSDPRLTQANANWLVIKDTTIDQVFNADQQRIIHEIMRGVTSEEGYDRFLRQMQDDGGGLGKFSCALFGDPATGKSAWLLTGRHLTLRAEGNALPDAVFGGPVIYGHGAAGNQKANLFYYQTQVANEVFQALDGTQREKALLPMAPAENSIQIKKSGFAGIGTGELSKDQRALVQKVMHQLLAPYREADVKEAMAALEANGGLSQVHLSFYRNEDLGSDREWDIWRLEGPTLVWHFRGAPHVHTWVNFRTKPVTG